MSDEYEDRARRRMHPKLRVLANSSARVLAAKAETQGCVVVSAELAAEAPPLAAAVASGEVSARATAIKDLDPTDRYANVQVNVFVQYAKPAAPGAEGGLAVKRVPLEEVENLAGDRGVTFVEHAETLKPPRPQKGEAALAAPRARRLKTARNHHGDGEGVLIGVIDVEGFDWNHPDFLDATGATRFEAIWDQGAPTDGSAPPAVAGSAYGRVLTRSEMTQAQVDAVAARVSPHDLEPQSEAVPGSHGTHVASIAAGRSGVCPKADIAAVLVSLPPDDLGRRTSFYDSTRLLDAVMYLLNLAGDRPVSINVSLGTNGHAHDGSSSLDRWLDALLSQPGRAICVAAGNAGQERPDAPGDLGFMLGRIHASGRIAAQGLDHDLEWEVVGDRIIDASENELELWYEPQDRFAISIRPPGGEWIGPIGPGEYLQNLQLPDRTLISIFNELHHAANGANYIAVYLTPFLGDTVVGVRSGTWLVRLHGKVVRDGRFHGWIERDDPWDPGDGSRYWPSYFSERSNVDASSVSALACGHRIVSVANLDEMRRRAHITSSQGPTRDGRPKPDVAAPGTDILAANGFGDPDEPWIGMTGTSMASPYVCGVVGLMLAAEPRLTAAQVLGVLKATAQPLPGGTFEWVNDCGFGVIQPGACVRAAGEVLGRFDAKGRFQ